MLTAGTMPSLIIAHWGGKGTSNPKRERGRERNVPHKKPPELVMTVLPTPRGDYSELIESLQSDNQVPSAKFIYLTESPLGLQS